MNLRPLDIVMTPGGGVAIVTEVCVDGSASIDYLRNCNPGGEKSAWWHPSNQERLIRVDSITRLLANAMAHPFGQNTRQGDRDVSSFTAYRFAMSICELTLPTAPKG